PPLGSSEVLDRRPSPGFQHPREGRILAVRDDQTRTWHYPYEVVKLPLDRSKIVEDVRMIELEIVENCGPRPVMHKFGALIEKGRVVLVRFDHEVLTPGKPGREREVVGYSADQEARVLTALLQDPGQHCRGSRLAVGSGNRQDVPPREHLLGKPLRPRYIAIA